MGDNDILVRFPAERAAALREAVTDGPYESEGELLAEAFEHWSLDRMLANPTEEQTIRMRGSVDEGLASGDPAPFDVEQIKRLARERLASRSRND